MQPTGIQLALYIAALLPLMLVALTSLVWWQALPHPWIFVAAGAASVYLLLVIVVMAVIFIGPGFGAYFGSAEPTNYIAVSNC